MDGENCGLIDLELIRTMAVAAVNPHIPGVTKQIIFVPDGFEEKEIPALHEIPLPNHIRQRLALVERESFTRYVKLYKGPSTQIFGTVTKEGATFVAVLDYHESGNERKANRALHIVEFNPQFSDEFVAWSAISGKFMSQDAFLDHLRRWGEVITSHTDADMIEIVSNLEFASSGKFSSRVERTTGGRKLTFTEVIEATSGQKSEGETKGITVPASMTMKSEIFRGGAKFEYSADLLYRISGGNLSIAAELKRPHKVVKEAIDSLIGDIKSETEVEPLIGTVKLSS